MVNVNVRRGVKHDDKKAESQNKHLCSVVGCGKTGRLLFKLGRVENYYCACPEHRKYGERVMNFFIDSVTRFKLSDFLSESKKDIFMKDYPELCDSCKEKLWKYMDDKLSRTNIVEELQNVAGKKATTSQDDFEAQGIEETFEDS